MEMVTGTRARRVARIIFKPRLMRRAAWLSLIFWGLGAAVPAVGQNLLWEEALLDEFRFRCPPATRQFIIGSAEDVLAKGSLFSVTFNEATSPVSNDPRDYFSTHANWWPNPDTADGLPYVRRDDINPDSRVDMDELTGVYLAVFKCALAFHLTGEERFGAHASDLVWSFFLDETTGIKPSMDYSKIIPGVDETGFFEVATFSNRIRKLWDSLVFLRPSVHWTGAHETGMRDWSGGFLSRMEQDPEAIYEFETTNNHSTAYHLVAAIFAKYTGDHTKAQYYGQLYATYLVPVQFDQMGRQPEEMHRSDNLFYHVYNLKTALDLGAVVDDLGLDLFHQLENPCVSCCPF